MINSLRCRINKFPYYQNRSNLEVIFLIVKTVLMVFPAGSYIEKYLHRFDFIATIVPSLHVLSVLIVCVPLFKARGEFLLNHHPTLCLLPESEIAFRKRSSLVIVCIIICDCLHSLVILHQIFILIY